MIAIVATAVWVMGAMGVVLVVELAKQCNEEGGE